jgi:excisionase family DNA binding protein
MGVVVMNDCKAVDMPQLMTVSAVVAALSVSRSTVYRMVKFGKLRTRKVGIGEKSFRILAEDVYAIVNPPEANVYTPGALRRRLGK